MTFLHEPRVTPAVQQMYDDDLAEDGYVMALTTVWAHHPEAHAAMVLLVRTLGETLTPREKAVVVSATAATVGDSYCALAWGTRLAGAASDDVAVSVLEGGDDGLSDRERALARWARRVASAPTATTAEDVAALRDAGLADHEVVAVTGYVAQRVAFSMVNAALGAAPDGPLAAAAPDGVRRAVTWGRPPSPS
jgi:uncharacterized peroxidase-related enzyme